MYFWEQLLKFILLSLKQQTVFVFQITPVIVERATLNLNVADKRKRQQQQQQQQPHAEMRNNFDVLIRILDAPMSYVGGAAATDDDDVSSVLTEDERFRLREVITHDVQIKKFLQVKIPIWIQLSLCKSELQLNC